MGSKSKSRGQARKGSGKAGKLLPRLRWNKLSAVEFALTTVVLASMLLTKPMPTAALSDVVENLFAGHVHVITATVLTVLLSLAVAAVLSLIIGSYIQGVVNRVLAPRFTFLNKPAIRLTLPPAATVLILCFALPQTRVWSLARLWWSGPAVDLVSASPGETFRPAINLPWVNYGQDFGVVAGWTRRGVSRNLAALDASFARLHESGVNCVLWFLLADGRGAPSFDEQGYVKGMDESFWEDYDAAIEVGRQHRISIIWVLLDFHWFADARQEAGATLSGHADVFEDQSKMESFLQRALLPIVCRHPYEPQIAGWILINEPENAFKEAHASVERIAEFTRRASALIKRNTYRQPVSVGSADLESLMEYWVNDASGLDFFIFHHYEKYLPPPADYVRKLMAGARDKPIYVGEFNLSAPPLPLDELTRWTGGLGYAGLWGWSLNDGAARPRYEEAKQFASAAAAAARDAKPLAEMFRGQGSQPTNSPGMPAREDSSWWLRYGTETVLPGVSANIRQWEIDFNGVETRLGTSKEERAVKEKELVGPVAECFRLNEAYLRGSKSKVEVLNAQLEDYRKQLEQAKTNKDEAWKKRVLGWQREAEGNLKKEQDNVTLYQDALQSCEAWKKRVTDRIQELDGEIKSGDALVSWYRYKILWSGKLYQEFWRAELQR